MIKHYLKIAIRQILKNKVQYLLSIIGIAIGLLCFSMTSYYIRRSNNQFIGWSNSDRIANMYVKSAKNNYDDPYIPGKELQLLMSNPVAGMEKIAYSYGYGRANITICKAAQQEEPFQCSFQNITKDFPFIFGMQTLEGLTSVLKPGKSGLVNHLPGRCSKGRSYWQNALFQSGRYRYFCYTVFHNKCRNL